MFLTFLDQGMSPGQAFNSAVDAAQSGVTTYPGADTQAPSTPGAPAADTAATTTATTVADPATVGEVYGDLPQDLQQMVLRDANALSPPVRQALDQLGVTQPQLPGSDDALVPGQVSAREAAGRADAPLAANNTSQAAGNTPQSAPPAQVASAFAAREAAPQQTVAFANPQAVPSQQGERAIADLAQAPQIAGRGAEGQLAARAPDGNVIVMADRANLAQQQQAQNLPAFAQGRPDALPAQAALATLVGATLVANPQGNPLVAQTPHAMPPGSTQGLDGAALQARDVQLAPAGHTLAGFLRRDRRRTTSTAASFRGESYLAGLLAGGRRRDVEAEETPYRWLFWLLTLSSYGLIALAIVAMIPAGGSLLDAAGDPNLAAYALGGAAVSALVSFVLGRMMSKR